MPHNQSHFDLCIVLMRFKEHANEIVTETIPNSNIPVRRTMKLAYLA